MDEKIFKLNLLKTIKELEDKEKFTCTEYVFKINTIEERESRFLVEMRP